MSQSQNWQKVAVYLVSVVSSVVRIEVKCCIRPSSLNVWYHHWTETSCADVFLPPKGQKSMNALLSVLGKSPFQLFQFAIFVQFGKLHPRVWTTFPFSCGSNPTWKETVCSSCQTLLELNDSQEPGNVKTVLKGNSLLISVPTHNLTASLQWSC